MILIKTDRITGAEGVILGDLAAAAVLEFSNYLRISIMDVIERLERGEVLSDMYYTLHAHDRIKGEEVLEVALSSMDGLPTEEGFYWHVANELVATIREVRVDVLDPQRRKTFRSCRSGQFRPLHEGDKGKWYGPLPLPPLVTSATFSL